MSTKKYIQSIVPQEPRTLDELAHVVMAVANAYVYRQLSRGKLTETPTPPVVGFAWNICWTDHVSNSHSSPEGMSQNWTGRGVDKDGNPIPRGYPGWTGRVWIRYADAPQTFGSEPLNRTLTHSGTGGGGSYSGPWKDICNQHYNRYGHRRGPGMYPRPACYSWDYRIYAQDWPLVAEQIDKERMWAILKNESFFGGHNFEWNDHVVRAADQAFLAECKTLNLEERAG